MSDFSVSLFGDGTQPLTLTGKVEAIVFRSPDADYGVITLKSSEDDVVTATGSFAIVQPGMHLQLWGQWTTHARYGQQFKVSHYQEVLPQSLEAIEAYLSSGLIPGIRARTAKLIVKHFGEETLNVLDTNPEALKSVKGLGRKKMAQIIEAWQSQQAVRETLLFLQQYGISSNLACKIYQHYEDRTLSVVRRNPYQLTDISGVGFTTADRLAQQLGHELDSRLRYQSGILHVLYTAAEDGHCYLLQELLEQQVQVQLSTSQHRPSLKDIQETIAQMQVSRELIVELDLTGQTLCYLPLFYQTEVSVATELQRLQAQVISADLEQVRQWLATYEQQQGFCLTSEQQRAVEMAATQPICLITGGPGTGKSLTASIIYQYWQAQGRTVVLGAPTGRAAANLAQLIVANSPESSEAPTCATIHRLLEFSPLMDGFQRNEDYPLEVQSILIDEVGMLDIFLARALLQAIATGTQLVLQGDVDQLASVGPGNFLKDVIESGVLPVIRLTQIFRQAQSSRIITHAHRINRGQLPEIEPISLEPQSDCLWRDAASPAEGCKAITNLLTRFLPKRGYDPCWDVQILSATLKGPIGTRSVNALVQPLLNPAAPEKTEWQRGDITYRVGDRVIQLKNNYELEVFNGDLGIIQKIQPDQEEMQVLYRQGVVRYPLKELDQLNLAYCLTVHKSQGGQYPVVIFLCYPNYLLMNRSLVYTALTRAQRLAIFVGSKSTLATSIKQLRNQRYTQLAQRLCTTN